MYFFACICAFFVVLANIFFRKLFQRKKEPSHRRVVDRNVAVFVTSCDDDLGRQLTDRLFKIGYTVFAGTEQRIKKYHRNSLIGAKVFAPWLDFDKDKYPGMFPGTILADNGDGTYCVQFDDGFRYEKQPKATITFVDEAKRDRKEGADETPRIHYRRLRSGVKDDVISILAQIRKWIYADNRRSLFAVVITGSRRKVTITNTNADFVDALKLYFTALWSTNEAQTVLCESAAAAVDPPRPPGRFVTLLSAATGAPYVPLAAPLQANTVMESLVDLSNARMRMHSLDDYVCFVKAYVGIGIRDRAVENLSRRFVARFRERSKSVRESFDGDFVARHTSILDEIERQAEDPAEIVEELLASALKDWTPRESYFLGRRRRLWRVLRALGLVRYGWFWRIVGCVIGVFIDERQGGECGGRDELKKDEAESKGHGTADDDDDGVIDGGPRGRSKQRRRRSRTPMSSKRRSRVTT